MECPASRGKFNLSDPDGEDASKVQGQFQVSWADKADGSDWGAKWTSPLTAAKTSGSRFTVDLNALAAPLPTGKQMQWQVRAWDGVQWGPWSSEGAQTGCSFVYDPRVPEAPTISSSYYLPDETWRDGVGVAKEFTIDDPSNLAVQYVVSVNDRPGKTVTTTSGAPQKVWLTPTKAGPNLVTAHSVTAANVSSSSGTYQTLVKAGRDARARFTLDESEGSMTVDAEVRGETGAVSAQVEPGATLGAAGQVEQAAQFDGTSGQIVADGPVVPTSQSFAVSAWVRVTDSTKNATAVSVDGTRKSGFYLGYRAASGTTPAHWAFAMTKADSDEAGWYEAQKATDTAVRPQVGEWAHLVGVYDATLGQQFLYVNGEQAGSIAHESAWAANRSLTIGRSLWAGAPAEFWRGDIDDVRIFDRVVGEEEAKHTFDRRPIRKARWKLNKDGADDLKEFDLTLAAGGASIEETAGFAGTPGLLLSDAVETGPGYAFTDKPVVDTSRSFTIVGWVHNSGRPQEKAVVFSQAGNQQQGFALRYVPGPNVQVQGNWQIEMHNADDSSDPAKTAHHSDFREGEWDHVAIVYNASRDTMSLYINGQPDVTASSEERDVRSFWAANQGLQVGRSLFGGANGSEHWSDALDDIWAYQDALSQDQITMLGSWIELETNNGP